MGTKSHTSSASARRKLQTSSKTTAFRNKIQTKRGSFTRRRVMIVSPIQTEERHFILFRLILSHLDTSYIPPVSISIISYTHFSLAISIPLNVISGLHLCFPLFYTCDASYFC